MSDAKKISQAGDADDEIDLTHTIRKLSMPTVADNDPLEDDGTVLLLCRDGTARKWGPRWLSQVGLQAAIPSDPSNALEIARNNRPDLIIVDASLTDGGGELLYNVLLEAADLEMPLLVLCSNNKEAVAAVDAGCFDIVRKPFEWQVISRRARHAHRLNTVASKLKLSQESLGEAVALADAARKRLRSRENFEPVTGLPNKSKFMELLKRGMAGTRNNGGVLAVFVVGFTRFRLVIEAMGQQQADLILTHIGNHLADCLHDTDTDQPGELTLRTAAAASLDQFRFGMMATFADDGDELTDFQQRVLDTVSKPIQVAGQTLYLSACLGIALFPQDADDADSLLQRADNAMRDAQSRGGGFKYYCTKTDAAAGRKLKIEHMLHEALDRNELSLVYQPIIEIASRKVTSAEALLRWRQADGTYISPGEFIPIAEESGLVVRIGEYVLDEACRQYKVWHEAGFPLPHMCVNVAKAQLMSAGFATSVRQVIDEHCLKPGMLELEISERGVLSGDYDVVTQLHDLKAIGIRLSIDDFGTGDSAIAYLKDLPVDALKIDRSYISGMTKNPKDEAIASAMIALGQRLDLMVIAEGVEEVEQLALLHKLGCDAMQGYLASKPMPPDDFVKLLRTVKSPK